MVIAKHLQRLKKMNIASNYSSLQGIYSFEILVFWKDCYFLIPFDLSLKNKLIKYLPLGLSSDHEHFVGT